MLLLLAITNDSECAGVRLCVLSVRCTRSRREHKHLLSKIEIINKHSNKNTLGVLESYTKTQFSVCIPILIVAMHACMTCALTEQIKHQLKTTFQQILTSQLISKELFCSSVWLYNESIDFMNEFMSHQNVSTQNAGPCDQLNEVIYLQIKTN